MSGEPAILDLISAWPSLEASVLPNAPFDLHLMAGECALVEAHDPERITAFADLCSGIVHLRQGSIQFSGYDWAELDPERAAALRGRIGRIYRKGAWISTLGTHVSIVLGMLHHTREPEQLISQAAMALARRLGLPGLPLERPDQLSDGDLARAACVRAFLGTPQLLLLERSIGDDHPELTVPILDLLSQALDRGAAAICFAHDAAFWRAQSFPISRRFRLLENGLQPVEID
jgi:phospholipid/cholesterol/gamma-HCH transport system ATP-binding protein